MSQENRPLTGSTGRLLWTVPGERLVHYQADKVPLAWQKPSQFEAAWFLLDRLEKKFAEGTLGPPSIKLQWHCFVYGWVAGEARLSGRCRRGHRFSIYLFLTCLMHLVRLYMIVPPQEKGSSGDRQTLSGECDTVASKIGKESSWNQGNGFKLLTKADSDVRSIGNVSWSGLSFDDFWMELHKGLRDWGIEFGLSSSLCFDVELKQLQMQLKSFLCKQKPGQTYWGNELLTSGSCPGLRLECRGFVKGKATVIVTSKTLRSPIDGIFDPLGGDNRNSEQEYGSGYHQKLGNQMDHKVGLVCSIILCYKGSKVVLKTTIGQFLGCNGLEPQPYQTKWVKPGRAVNKCKQDRTLNIAMYAVY